VDAGTPSAPAAGDAISIARLVWISMVWIDYIRLVAVAG
jgi:hypothetical protein